MVTSKTIMDDAAEYVTHECAYDSIDRLVGETNLVYASSGPMAPPTLGTNSVVRFNYDLAGNRTSVVAVDGSGEPFLRLCLRCKLCVASLVGAFRGSKFGRGDAAPDISWLSNIRNGYD